MDMVHLKHALIVTLLCLSIAGCVQQSPAPSTTSSVPVTPSTEKPRPQVDQSAQDEQAAIPNPTFIDVNAPSLAKEAGAALKQPLLLPESQAVEPAATPGEKQQQTITQVVYSEEDALKTRGKPVVTNDRPFTEAKYLPDELVGVAVVHPQQILNSPIGEFLKKKLDAEQSADQLTDLLKLFLDDIDRITLPIAKREVNELRDVFGLSADGMVSREGAVLSPADFSKMPGAEPLSDIQGAFQAYHNAWGKFPRADGDGEGRYRGLSWRVHLLPYLDQNELYDQFHLDEPWDSKHNKALICKMPDVFKSPGVTDEGKTAFHVFTGEGTYFSGTAGYELKPSEEEMESHKLLVILAGADTADYWTKPGGLEFDESDARKMLGEKREEPYLGVLASGSIRQLPADISERQLAGLVLLNSDGEETEVMLDAVGGPPFGVVGLPNSEAFELQQIGQAMQAYVSTYFVYPRADGDGPGMRTGLSWRVHLLPFLEEEELYREFHLDEPWDSEHNKTLISRMPDVFRVAGVHDEGKTSFHVFTGENTLFLGEWGHKPDEIEVADPILVVQAGSDKADIWTKPGGLDVDFNDPVKCLGQVNEEIVAIGSFVTIKRFPADVSASILANAIRRVPAVSSEAVSSEVDAPAKSYNTLSTMIITLNKDVPQTKVAKCLLDDPDEEQFEGQTIQTDEQSALWFPDARTVVGGSVDTVKQIISNHKQEDRENSPLIDLLKVGPDISFAVGLESFHGLLEDEMLGIPMLGAVNNIKAIDGQVSLSAQASDSLVSIDFTMVEPEFATGLFAIANIVLTQGRMMFCGEGVLAPGGEQFAPENTMAQLMASAKVEIKDDKLVFNIPIPDKHAGLSVLFKNIANGGVWNLIDSDQVSSLYQVGAGFQNFEETFGAFPAAGCQRTGQPVGLSWRVHLLPFVGEPALYRQFKLDEPWDSEHNKTLIEKMPDIYKSPGVMQPGKTSMHVFVGQKSPFADHRAPQLVDFGADLQNAILMVVAGPDKADIWTKPGGLDFDPQNPIQALGKATGPAFMAIRGDGSSLPLDKLTDPSTLSGMIQPSRTDVPHPPRVNRINRFRQGIDFPMDLPAF